MMDENNRNKTIIILDWDDTLFPTTWTLRNHIDLTSSEVREKYIGVYSKLDKVLHNFLYRLQKCGQIIIITNALTSWIYDSASVLPRTKKLMRNIKVISARELYQNKYTITEWKKNTFRNEVKNQIKSVSKNNGFNPYDDDIDINNLKSQYSQMQTNTISIISIGDADYEYNALINLINLKTIPNKQKILKAIKLLHAPTFSSLLDQLIVLYKAIPDICSKQQHLDWKFEIRN